MYLLTVQPTMESGDETDYQDHEECDDKGEVQEIVEDDTDGETVELAVEAAIPDPEPPAPTKPSVSSSSSQSAPPIPSKPSGTALTARSKGQARVVRRPAARHVDRLDEQTEPAPPLQPRRPAVQVVQGKKKSILSTAVPSIALIFGVIMIVVVIMALLFPTGFGSTPVKKMPSMFYELTDNVWPKQCTPVTIEEMEAGKVNILSKEIKLGDLRDSLTYHIEEKGEQGLCAQNLEKKPICYCVLATGSPSQPYLEMYNMIRVGDSFPVMEVIPEENTFCKHPVDKLRYNHVTVRFQTPNGTPDRQRFEAPESYVIQAFDDMLRGVSRCEDTKEQLMMHDIHDGVRYLSREQMYKEYGYMARAYPEGLLPDVQLEDRRERRSLPSGK